MRLKNVSITTRRGKFTDDIVNPQIINFENGELLITGYAVREKLNVGVTVRLSDIQWDVTASEVIGRIEYDEAYAEAEPGDDE
jgi:hypothetical protein